MSLFRYLFSPKMLMPAIAVVATGILGFALVNQSPANAATCDKDNDIVYCGYTNPTDLANKTNASAELQAIYNNAFTANYGMGDTNAYKANAKHATVYKDGRVVLDDGTVLATGANTIGRQKFNDQRKAVTIAGKTYYYSATSASFSANTNSLPAYVLVNDDHSLKFGALTACGNAVWGNSPGYKCQMLNQEKVNDTTYSYSTTVYKKDATLTKLVYDFGDGKTQTVTSNFDQKVSHTYAPGKFTAKVTAYFSANNQEKSDTRAECTKPVDVPQPPKPVFACTGLTAIQVEGSRTKFTFTVTGKAEHATLKSGSIDFGDNQTASDLTPASETTVVTPHDYAKAGTYHATAKLVYDKGTTTEECVYDITIAQTCIDTPNAPECQPPVKECKPGIPEGDERCKETPKELPSTGPIEIIGSALGLGGIAGASMYYRGTRRNLIDTILNKR